MCNLRLARLAPLARLARLARLGWAGWLPLLARLARQPAHAQVNNKKKMKLRMRCSMAFLHIL